MLMILARSLFGSRLGRVVQHDRGAEVKKQRRTTKAVESKRQQRGGKKA